MRYRMLLLFILGLLLALAAGQVWPAAPAQAQQVHATHVATIQQPSQDATVLAVHGPQPADTSVGGLAAYALLLGVVLTLVALIGLRTCGRPTAKHSLQHRRL